MAFYGIQSAEAITATTANDTIDFFGSTATLNGATVLGLDGNDVIYLGAQGYTGAATAVWTQTTAAATGVGTLSASLVGSATYTTGTGGTATAAGEAETIAITGIITSQRGTRSLVNSQLYANAGNDVIALGAQGGTWSSSTIGGGAGNDKISNQHIINGATSNATSVADGLTGDALTANKIFVEAGGGKDTVAFDFLTTATISNSTFGGGQDNDTFTFSAAATGSFKTSFIALGGGNDTLTSTLNFAIDSTINGGGGADTIVFNVLSGASAVIVDGDLNGTIGDFDGNDLISAAGNASSGEFVKSSFYGGGGNDTINFNVSAYSAVDGRNLFALNVGNDVLSAYWSDTDTVQMGAGTDSITITTAARSSQFYLGGDKDTFTYQGVTAGSGATFDSNTIFGGGGADFLSATNGIGDTETAGVNWSLSSISDSTLTARDTIGFGGSATSVIYRASYEGFDLSLGSFRTGDQSATNGIVTFTAGFASDVTSRATLIDGNMTSQGEVAGFSDGDGNAFLFIQGATEGYSIVQLGQVDNTSISAITVAAGNDLTITMGQ